MINWKIGDCLELMKEIPDKSVDMVLTDLPYGTTSCLWDCIIDLKILWSEYKRIIKNNGSILLFGSEPFSSILRLSNIEWYKYDWIWLKNFSGGFVLASKRPLKYHENISVFYNSQPVYNPQMIEYADSVKKRFKDGQVVNSVSKNNIQNISSIKHLIDYTKGSYPKAEIFFKGVTNANSERLHPTQKPLELIEYLIKTYTNEGDMVHDSCLGSGTTLKACSILNRNCIGFEIDPQYEKYYKEIISQVRFI